MRDDHKRHIAAWTEHIRVLADEIGPRGSATGDERRAAEYAQEHFASLGYKAQMERFISARSSYQVHTLVGLGIFVAFVVYPLAGRVSAGAAALLAFVAIASESLEMLFRDNPARRLIAKGPSQNVIATLPPAQDHKRDLILMGHIDSHHASFIFSTTRRTDFWRVFGPVAYFSFCWAVLVYSVGTVTQSPWVWPASLVSGVCAVILIVMCVQGDLSPYSPGANDNATGAALVLALAGHLRSEPLEHTRVWLVCSGCEEVKHYGAIDFYERHHTEFHNPAALVFETMGVDGPAWVEREFILPPFPYEADPDLCSIARQIADESPELRANPTRVVGAHTEMADALRLGIPAITFIGIGPDGVPIGYQGPELYWHRIDDTYDKIDHEVLNRAYAFTWAFIQALDRRAE
jgi:hypothetical protein